MMTGALALAVAEGIQIPDGIGSLALNYGPLGIFVLLFIFGYIVPKGTLDISQKNGRTWHTAYEDEKDAHEETREALKISLDTTKASQEHENTTLAILRDLGHKTGDEADEHIS